MNAVAWVIIVINLNYGNVTRHSSVTFASRGMCEEVLAEVQKVNAASKAKKFSCTAVVVPQVVVPVNQPQK